MSEVRRVQRESGKKFTGRPHLPDETLEACFDAWDGSRLLAELRSPDAALVPHGVQGHLFERFEEMCRRRHVPIPDDLRPAVYRLLALELVVNVDALAGDAESLTAATLFNGSLDDLAGRFPDLADTPGFFRMAARSYPADPAVA